MPNGKLRKSGINSNGVVLENGKYDFKTLKDFLYNYPKCTTLYIGKNSTISKNDKVPDQIKQIKVRNTSKYSPQDIIGFNFTIKNERNNPVEVVRARST